MQTDILASDLAHSVDHKKLLNTTIVGDSKEQCEKVTKGTQGSGEKGSPLLEGEN